jgi:hypothetical protein
MFIIESLAQTWTQFCAWLATLPQSSASFLGTLTGSGLGLIALLLGALFNARLNRKRDDRLRDADRVALATALHAELVGVHRALTENAQHLTDKPPNSDGGFVVPKPSIKILPELLSKIGLLRPDDVRKVLDAYVLTEQYLDRLILGGGMLRTDMPEKRELVYVGAQLAPVVIEYNRATADDVKKAIDALTPYLK